MITALVMKELKTIVSSELRFSDNRNFSSFYLTNLKHFKVRLAFKRQTFVGLALSAIRGIQSALQSPPASIPHFHFATEWGLATPPL